MGRDVCIVGGGVIGCALALELSGTGARVTVVERGVLGAESSWAGAGLLMPLLPWHYREPVLRLTQWGRALYADWVAGLRAASGIDPEYRVSGMLVLPPYDVARARAWAVKAGEPLECTPARLIEPALAAECEALWLPSVAQVRNPRLMQALAMALRARAVRILEHTAARGWRIEGDRVLGLKTDRGELPAEAYVIAAGAWSAALAPEAGVPIGPVRGQIVLLKATPGRLRRVLYCDGLYVIPRDDGHLLIGSTLEDAGFDKSVTKDARDELLARAMRWLPWLAELPRVGHWAGLRPASPDNVPIIGRHPRIANLYMSSGHFRYGVTMAPASAKLLSGQILGAESDDQSGDYGWPNEAAPKKIA